MAISKNLNVVIELAGSEQARAATYHKAMQYVISKCMCEVSKDESSHIFESINRGTGREGLFYTGTEGRMQ